MLKKLASPSVPGGAMSGAGMSPGYKPYASQSANALYNMLFCDDASAFAGKPGAPAAQWQKALLSMPADILALQELACDVSLEGRVRYLAFARLRESGHTVLPKILLGVIAEVPMPGGLDALAAFREGSVRYINQSEKILVMEGATRLAPIVDGLFAATMVAMGRIGPWDRPRLGPPAHGNIRLSFLVSDGLYFCEGPMPAMRRDGMAGPIIEWAAELLQAVTAATAD